MDKNKKDLIEKALQKAVDNYEIAGANILVIDEGQETYYNQIGLADIATNEKIKRDTIFRLYSMTKPVTAVATMILMERGEIDLMDPVYKYIPGFENQKVAVGGGFEKVKHDVTIKELLNMTSGLLYGGDNVAGTATSKVLEELDERLFTDEPMTTLELANEIGCLPLDFQPGESWNYGISADILGAVIESATDKSFGEFLKEELFEPLGMVDTGFFVPKEKQSRLAKTYETTEQGLLLYKGNNLGITNKMEFEPSFQSGGAGLVSTVDDYAKFATMLMNDGTFNGKTILSKKTVEFLTTQTLDEMQYQNFRNWNSFIGHSYGNLMRVCTNPELGSGILSKGEYGWDGWLGCYFANLPEEEKTILIMMQKKDAGTTALTRKLRNIILS